jgi:hypothetical protein
MLKRLGYLLFFATLVFIGLGIHSCKKFSNKIDYSTQVKPILNRNCLSCHGGVKKQGGFSLLFKEEAYAKCESGKYAIVPGDASSSEMIKRINHHDPEERMPYEKDPLTKEEIDILTKWIDQGAEWGEHWAYQPLQKQVVPDNKSEWVKNDIDQFIFQKANEHGLKMSNKADPATLARRLGLDIIGIPTPEPYAKPYLDAPVDQNLDLIIDSLLASPHFGEKWTSMWLDLARYADTKGYERDGSRNVWRYRDWLINAFNKDMPYDQFLKEQLAGDLLPNPTDEQYTATAFHRNTMTNDEGGTDNEEYRTAAVIDRVNATWETLMGTTFACVQCHSHPYDPIKHEEYYQFMGYFNNTRDEDTYHDYPILRHFDDSEKQKLLGLEKYLEREVGEKEKNQLIHFIKTLQPSYNSIACTDLNKAALADTKFLNMRNNSSAKLSHVKLDSANSLVMEAVVKQEGGIWQIRLDKLDGPIIATHIFKKPQEGGFQNYQIPIKPIEGVHDLYFTYSNPSLKDSTQNGIGFNWFYFYRGFPSKTKEGITFKKQFDELLTSKSEGTPIMMENPANLYRETNIFERGSWLSKGPKVEALTPQFMNPFPKEFSNNRLGLAHWMADKKNPLVARTIVNRIWEQLFGVGLVETLEDLGSQGATPTHKELLDHLSYKLMHEYNWSLKKMIKEIVSSATYQQDSKLTKEALEKDVSNKYLARGSRVRLSAEQIRDQALAISGSLNPTMYGAPVMPYQPEGIWNSPYGGSEWVQSDSANQYRRAVYTYWKRTSPYPSMITFDGVGREVCSSRRIRTNTPLQALVVLNDSVYMDISKKLALKVMSNKTISNDDRIATAYKMATCKQITKEKLTVLKSLYEDASKKYTADKKLLEKMMLKGKEDDIAFASFALVCNSILNLDEVITKT